MDEYYTYDPEYKVIVTPGGTVLCRGLGYAAIELNRLRRFIQYIANEGPYEEYAQADAERVLKGEDFRA